MDIDRISTCTYPVRSDPLDFTFRLAAKSGYRKVDLWGGPPNYASDPAECDIAAVKANAESHGLTVANLGTYAGRTIADIGYEGEMKIMHNDIDNAVVLGARSIRVSPGHGEDPSIRDELIPFFAEAAAYAADRSVFLGMENHKGSLAANPDDIMPLVEAVDSRYFGILYEPANLMACDVDYKEAYRRFRGHIVHVHIKDSRRHEGVYERTMLGEGDIDITWVVNTLESDGYDGDYALEFEIEKQVPIEKGLPAWLEYFREIG